MLNIKNPETHHLARLLAEATGESLTEAVTIALREKLARLEKNKKHAQDKMRREIEKIVQDIAKLPVYDNRTPDEIIGYDEYGLPS